MVDYKTIQTIPVTTIYEHLANVKINAKHNCTCTICKSGTGQNKTGALHLYTDTNSWFCFSCSIGGDVIDLVAKTNGVSNKDAANYLQENFSNHIGQASSVNEVIPNNNFERMKFAIKQNPNEEALDYLTLKRKISVDSYLSKNIYYDSYHNSAVFFDKNELLLNYRGIDSKSKGNSKGSLLIDSYYDKTYRKNHKKVFLTEGVINSLSVYSVGYSGIALFSTGNLFRKRNFLESYLENKDIILAFDHDDSGNKYTQYWLDKLEGSNIRFNSVHRLKLPSKIDLNNLHIEGKLREFLINDGNYKQLLSSRTLSPEDIKKIFEPVYDKEGNLKDIKIIYMNLIEVFYSLGFIRFDSDMDYIFVRNVDNVITQVTTNYMRDVFIENIENLPDDLGDGVTRNMLLEKFYRNPSQYFNDIRFTMLKPRERINFIKDSKNTAYIFFANGFVQIDKSNIKLLPYSELKGNIWDSQIIDRDFNTLNLDHIQNEGVFKKFVFNIANKDTKRFDSLCSIMGYLLHAYHHLKLRGIVLTDSLISDGAEGRTGKTLLAKGIGKIRVFEEINGKDFDNKNKHKYQSLKLDTEIVHLNDMRQKFNYGNLFNDITESVNVEKKNKSPFKIQIKMIVSTNQTIRMEGGSARDRAIEFELSDHYSDKYSPENEFGHWFFKDWDKKEWQYFDNFLLACLQLYLKSEIIIVPSINLERRKLIEETNEDFVTFIDQWYKEGKIILKQTYDKKDIHQGFLTMFPDYVDDRKLKLQRTTTKFLKKWAQYTPGVSSQTEESSSGNKQYICFYPE